MTDNEKFRTLTEHDSVGDDKLYKRKNIEDEKQDIRKKLSMSLLEERVQKLSFFDALQNKLRKSGSDDELFTVLKRLIRFSAVISGIALLGVMLILIFSVGMSFGPLVLIFFLSALLGFPSVYGLVFVFYKMSLELKAFSRKLAVEKVLPDYLRLVAINHRSGLSLDAALLQSNKKSFGLLSDEMERVIKESRVTGDLAAAIESFGKRFDSKLLDQTFKSIGISFRNGSNISQLLDDIVDNINNMRLLRRELVANVRNYVIFIIVAGLIIMPFMLALSARMNMTISDIKQDFRGIDLSESQLSMLNLGEDGGATPQSFLIYVVLLLATNSLFVALLLSAIKYGNIKQNLRSIPLYMLVSFAVYFVSSIGLTAFF